MKLIITFILLFFLMIQTSAQELMPSGVIISVNQQTVVAQFNAATGIGVGDEIEFLRDEDIIDPVSNRVRGHRTRTIGSGVVTDIGLGKATINITHIDSDISIQPGDHAQLTGTAKAISRPEAPQYGDIQEISNDEITTTLGIEDNISEGDIFLIQRFADTKTDGDEASSTEEINIGRISVSSVDEGRSSGKIIDLKDEPRVTDKVVKEADYLAYKASLEKPVEIINQEANSSQIEALQNEIAELRARLEQIEMEQHNQGEMLSDILYDMQTIASQFMTSDIEGTIIKLKNDEPQTFNRSDRLFQEYQKSLQACLTYDFDTAIAGFSRIINNYPNSEITENCRYWIALSHYTMKQYDKAIAGFQQVLNDKRFTHKDDDASIMLAITYYRINDRNNSIKQFQSFISDYPTSEYVPKVDYWIRLLSS